MRAKDIKDAESLQAWLESLPQETEAERETARRWVMTIAHRAAMRVLPVYWAWTLTRSSVSHSTTALSALRCALIACAAEQQVSPALISAAKSARKFTGARAWKTADDNKPSGMTVAAFAVEAAHAAGLSVLSVELSWMLTYQFCEDVSEVSVVPLLQTDGLVWESVRSDAKAQLSSSPSQRSSLWIGTNPVASIWAETRPKILAQGEGWRFWVEWYENALHGRPQDYDLLTKIALIDPADWDKGADHVNAMIQRIVAEHKPAPATKAPLAKEIVERVKASVPINAATLALQLHSLLEAIVQEREHLRGLNAFSVDEKQELHDALDNLESAARHLLDLLPEQTALTEQAAEDMASWAVVLKDQAQHWNVEAKRIVAGKPADDRVAFAGRLVFAAAVATPLSLMGLGSFAAVAGGAILLKDKLDVQKAKDAIRSVTSSQ